MKRLLLVYGLYLLCRLLFFFANRSYFQEVEATELIEDCFYGLRFDTFSIIISNSLFILLSILPFGFFYSRIYQRFLLFLFILTNTVFLVFNCVDVGYYPFIKKRSSSEIFKQMGGQSDMGKLIPQFLVDFWWIVLFFIALIWVLVIVYNRIRMPERPATYKKPVRYWILVILLFLFVTTLATIGARGGLQRVPIDIVNAGSMTRPEEVPIVLNTPFSLIKSFTQESLPVLNYYSEPELKSIYDPIHKFQHKKFQKQNVVVLILESFSKEYTKLGKTISVTPFLDSLMDHSLVFTNAFSNGTKSIEGIPAILSGLPSLMVNPFINSIYANNKQTSFPILLKDEGYESAFFHGGVNGTMNFDDWAALAGYDHYFGMNEYGNEKDYDNYWGIWDEPFLKYSVEKMNGFKQPFHSAIFTLSSHHPYFIPNQYKNKFPKTHLENAESIAYADHALKVFFNEAKKTSWYKNTLFVLVADHSGISEHPFYSNLLGNATIPVLFYRPDNSLKGEHARAFSQVDILPSVMDQLGYSKPFFAFGESYKEENYGNDYFFASSTHYLFGDSTLYCFNYPKISQAFIYRRDSLLHENIHGRDPLRDSLMFRSYKAFIQTYNNSIIQNKMKVEN